MDNQQIVSAINEAIQDVMPTLIDKVTEKLNNPKPRKWGDLDTEDLQELLNTDNIENWCRAAAHPNLSPIDMDYIIETVINDNGKSYNRVLDACFRNPNLTSEQASRLIDYNPDLKVSYYKHKQNLTVHELIDALKSDNKKLRQKCRAIMDQKILNGVFDSARIYNIPDVLKECRPQKLIEYTKDPDYNTRHFAEVKLQRLAELFLERNDVAEVFGYWVNRTPYHLREFYLNCKKRKEETETRVAHGIHS